MSANWEISRDELQVGRVIGSGNFGNVFVGKWKGKIKVAIKEMKNGKMSKEEFIQEATTMKTFRHENLLKLYCVCTEKMPLYIVTEFMCNGSLKHYLQEQKKQGEATDVFTLHYYSAQIASGMSYLEEQDLVHRDLAARNVLVGDNNVVKVADFGLSRIIETGGCINVKHETLPIKWMAPESIANFEYSSKSDVFSFGVVLYEIYTLGDSPWSLEANANKKRTITNREVMTAVLRGERMKKPSSDYVDEAELNLLYDIMMKCWHHYPSDRPTFISLKATFNEFKNTMRQYE